MERGPPLPVRVVPQSAPMRVSVVLVEETPGGSAGELPSSLPGEVCCVLAGAALPAGVKDDLNDVAVVVPAEAACLVEAGLPFPAYLVGTQTLYVRDRLLSPTDPAGILFPADLAEPVTVCVVGLADAGILFPAVSEGILFPADPAGMPASGSFSSPIAGERCGNAGSDPEARAPCGGSAASASNVSDSGSAACTGGGDQISGIGNVAPKFTFGEFDPSATVSTGTHSTGLEYGSVFFLRQSGP